MVSGRKEVSGTCRVPSGPTAVRAGLRGVWRYRYAREFARTSGRRDRLLLRRCRVAPATNGTSSAARRTSKATMVAVLAQIAGQRPNSTLKLARPGFGPALKRLGRTVPVRRHAGCRLRVAVHQYARQPPRRYSQRRGPRPCSLAPMPLGRRKHLRTLANHAIQPVSLLAASPGSCPTLNRTKGRERSGFGLSYLKSSVVETGPSTFEEMICD